MKKLKIPPGGYHAFLLFPLSTFISASFSQLITGLLSGENNKPLTGATVTTKGAYRSVTTGNDDRFVLTM